MSDEPDALEPDVLGVLRTATPSLDVPGPAKARILASVESRVGPLGGVGGSGGAPSSGAHGLKSAPGGASHLAHGAWVAAHPFLALGGALAVGGLVGALVQGSLAARSSAPPTVVYVDRFIAAPSAPVAAAAPAADPGRGRAHDAIDPGALPTEFSAPTPRPTAPALDSSVALAAESALLDVARTALARGEADHALEATARHAAQFPNGALREEREALAVKALVLAGRGADARARADRFRARYPSSLFSTAIDSSLGSVREMDSGAPRQP